MADDGEVTSPLKRDTPGAKEKETIKSGTGRRLFQEEVDEGKKGLRKRKPRYSGTPPSQTLDLNMSLGEGAALVPIGLVSARVGQLGGGSSKSEAEVGRDEMLKKQKRATTNNDVGSAVAVGSSPRWAP